MGIFDFLKTQKEQEKELAQDILERLELRKQLTEKELETIRAGIAYEVEKKRLEDIRSGRLPVPVVEEAREWPSHWPPLSTNYVTEAELDVIFADLPDPYESYDSLADFKFKKATGAYSIARYRTMYADIPDSVPCSYGFTENSAWREAMAEAYDRECDFRDRMDIRTGSARNERETAIEAVVFEFVEDWKSRGRNEESFEQFMVNTKSTIRERGFHVKKHTEIAKRIADRVKSGK